MHWPLTNLVALCWTFSSLSMSSGENKTGHSVQSRRIVSSFGLLTTSVHTAHDADAYPSCQGTLRAPVQPSPGFQELLPSQSVPSLCCCKGFFLPRWRTSHFTLMNFIRFLSNHFSRPQDVSLLSEATNHLSNMMSSGKLMMQHSTCSGALVRAVCNYSWPLLAINL